MVKTFKVEYCTILFLIDYKVKMDEAAHLVMPYFVLPKIGYC